MRAADTIIGCAIEESSRSSHYEKHGAVVYKKGKIKQSGRNQYCDAKRVRHFNSKRIFSVHAEMNALAGIPKRITKGADIMVVRTNKEGELCNSHPCEVCMSLIRSANIRRILYSTDEGTIVSKIV